MRGIVLLSLLGLGAYALLSGGSSVADTHGGSSGAGVHMVPTRFGSTLGPQQPSITYNFPQEPALPAINLKSPAQAFGYGSGGSVNVSAWTDRNIPTKTDTSITPTRQSSGRGGGIYSGTRGPIDSSPARTTTKKTSSALPPLLQGYGGIPVPPGAVGPRAPSPGPYSERW